MTYFRGGLRPVGPSYQDIENALQRYVPSLVYDYKPADKFLNGKEFTLDGRKYKCGAPGAKIWLRSHAGINAWFGVVG
jgi:hypothetical protein